MLNIRKRPYTEVAGLFGDVVNPFNLGGEPGADLNCSTYIAANASSDLPQGGPADLEFLLQLPEACMNKDVRAAVYKAACAGGVGSSFLGVRRKQRSLKGAWTVTVTIEQTPTTIGGKFADEIIAARAHDLLVLLFCTGRAARRINFQAWTYAEELTQFKSMPLAPDITNSKYLQEETIAKMKERQAVLFKYNQPWCQTVGERSSSAATVPLRPLRAAPTAQQLRMQAAANKSAARTPPTPRCYAAPVPQAAGACDAVDGSAAASRAQRPAPPSGTVRRYYMQGVFKPAEMGAGLHAVAAQLESLLGPRLGVDLPDGFHPPMSPPQEESFLRRFHAVMKCMGLLPGGDLASLAPVDTGGDRGTCAGSAASRGRGPSKHIRMVPSLSPGMSMDENTNPNLL